MRRYLAATVAVSAVFFAAACSGGSSSSGTATAAPTVNSSAAAAADKALSTNTAAICAQAGRTVTSFSSTFAGDLKVKAAAALQGSAAKSGAAQKISQDVQSFNYALRDMGGLTTDAKLRSALASAAEQVTAAKGDITKLNPLKMAQLAGSIHEACS